MAATAEPTLHALTAAAVQATGADSGWLLGGPDPGALSVLATSGAASTAIGTPVSTREGVAGFVMGSGQPMSITPSSSNHSLDADIAALAGRAPGALLCVPCANDEDIAGVLVLIDEHGGASFTIDDVELATLLAGVAGVALGDRDVVSSAPEPAALAAELEELARREPDRYRTVAALIEALLGS